MAAHAEYTLRCACITQVVDFALAIATTETCRAERLVACEDSEVFNFIPTRTAAVCAVVADEGAVPKKKKIGVGV